ncbi:hypothetical protein V6N13_070608 [Hibiscus sabdariffa]
MPHQGNPHTSGSMKNQKTILGLAPDKSLSPTQRRWTTVAMVAPRHQSYTQTWHHRVRMDKSLPLKLTNLGFEGSETCSRFAG